MKEFNKALERQPRITRFLCHLYQRLQQQRLNLVIGAGTSVEAGVPTWFGLLDRLAENSEELKLALKAHRSSGLSPEYLGQIIFHRHKNSAEKLESSSKTDAKVNYDWADSIQKSIYKDVNKDIAETLKNHSYLEQLSNLTQKVQLAINFNFDDILAQAVTQSTKGKNHRTISVEWRPTLLERRDHTTIYHVNGLLPQISLKKRSPRLIFTEDSFADALARSPGISAEFLLMRFIQNTMLIIGHSLADASLKNYLRQNKDKNPANHHYMIYWIENDLPKQQQEDIFEANLELYNVITIFLTSREINIFLSIINKDPREFRDTMDRLGSDKRSSYHYYIAGPVAAGKSSLLEQLRCFETYEEWTQPPPPSMYLSHEKATPEELTEIDNFIYGELKEKNIRFSAANAGFHFMDRAPLDLYAFSRSSDENKEKTLEIESRVTRDAEFKKGEIIFLSAAGEELVQRNYTRGRRPDDAGDAAYYESQKQSLKNIYNPRFEIETDKYTPGQIAKKVVRHILLEDYTPTDLGEIMQRYR